MKKPQELLDWIEQCPGEHLDKAETVNLLHVLIWKIEELQDEVRILQQNPNA